jgi:hypothetical protein
MNWMGMHRILEGCTVASMQSATDSSWGGSRGVISWILSDSAQRAGVLSARAGVSEHFRSVSRATWCSWRS